MRQTSTTAASAATVYETEGGSWPDAALAMKSPAAARTSSAVTASHSGLDPARRVPAGGVPDGGDVDRPQRKQTIALSEISVPQCRQVTPCAPNFSIIYLRP